MATPHLTYSGTGANAHLNAVTRNGEGHLAVVSVAQWNAKELVVTPEKTYFAWGAATAHTNAPTGQISNDLTGGRNTAMQAFGWKEGKKALVNYFANYNAPSVIKSGGSYSGYSEFGGSALALKFNLRYLPLKEIEAGVYANAKIYVRAYCPSLMYADPSLQPHEGIAANVNTYTQVRYKFFDSRPESAHEITGAVDMFDIRGTANNGLAFGSTCSTCKNYDPYNSKGNDLPLRVYASSLNAPAVFYRDYELTNTSGSGGVARSYLLAKGRGEVWLGARFNHNSIYQGANSSVTCYIQRLELVMKLTKQGGLNL